MLNRIWGGFFLVSLMATMLQLAMGLTEVLAQLSEALFATAKLAGEIAFGLVGILALWMGLMRLGELSGVVALLARLTEPLLVRLMPGVPRGDKAFGSITMNLTANMLGLDNAATPLGLRAMQDLQRLNPHPDKATDAQILFLVLNTSSVTLVPVTVFLYRAQQGAASPADIFLPILLATSASTLAGVGLVALIQRIRLNDAVLLGYAALLLSALVSLLCVLFTLPGQMISTVSAGVGNGILLALVLAFVLVAWWKRVPVYDEFIAGAKDGFTQAIALLPYLLAMLLAIALFRASGALELLLTLISTLVQAIGGDTRFVDALPTALMKPFSGSGARAMMLETMHHYGVDSFAGRLAAIFQGSTETTFYVLAVYFGAVKIRHTRYALGCGLFADLAGIIAAIAVCYWFYA